MSIEGLLRAYDRHLDAPWDPLLAGPQKVWFAIYDPPDERRLRARIDGFRIATEAHGYVWRLCDVTHAFAEWMGAHEYRDAYFESPDDLDEAALEEFTDEIIALLTRALSAPDADERTVVAVHGAGSLFGITHVSRVVNGVADAIQGRLLVFFPGDHEGNNYRLLDARDGWNYMAVPIADTDGARLR